MWGALFAASLLFPQPYTHLTHAVWYLMRSFLVPPPRPLHYDGKDIYPTPSWYAFALISVAHALPLPNLLDYTWIPLVLFCIMGYTIPLWVQILQTSFFAGYVRLRPSAVCVLSTVLWKHVHMCPRTLWAAAAMHGLLAFFEPVGDPSFVFVSILAAECKYRMTAQPYRQVFYMWIMSFAGMCFDRRLVVWTLPTLTSVVLGKWIHQWQYTDKVFNGNGVYLLVSLGVPVLLSL